MLPRQTVFFAKMCCPFFVNIYCLSADIRCTIADVQIIVSFAILKLQQKSNDRAE